MNTRTPPFPVKVISDARRHKVCYSGHSVEVAGIQVGDYVEAWREKDLIKVVSWNWEKHCAAISIFTPELKLVFRRFQNYLDAEIDRLEIRYPKHPLEIAHLLDAAYYAGGKSL